MEQFESHYFRGQGGVFIGELDANNNPANLIYVGDVSSAELTPDIQRSQVIENKTGAGAIGASWVKSVQYSLALQMRSVKPDHLALALQGTKVVKAGASVTDEAHVSNHDAFINLLHNKVSAVTVTNVGGATTYVAGTDYVLHADEGMIEVLSTGSMVDAAGCEVDYTYASQHHINANPGTNLNKALVFSGVNSTNSKQVKCSIYRIKLDPSALSMITDEAADMALAGQVELVSARPAGDQLYSWELED